RPGAAAVKRGRVALAGTIASALLLANAWSRSRQAEPPEGRYWEEMDIATLWYVDGVFPFASYEVGAGFFTRAARAQPFREAVAEAASRAGIKPWQFWRTVPGEPFRGQDRYPVKQADDRGRIAALVLGFRILGGIAPYLLFWLGPLLVVPLLFW